MKIVKLNERDFLCIVVLVVLLATLIVGASHGKGREVPADERHRTIYQGIKSGRSRAESELVCSTCHGQSALPLPKDHPPKEQCLICHLLADKA